MIAFCTFRKKYYCLYFVLHRHEELGDWTGIWRRNFEIRGRVPQASSVFTHRALSFAQLETGRRRRPWWKVFALGFRLRSHLRRANSKQHHIIIIYCKKKGAKQQKSTSLHYYLYYFCYKFLPFLVAAHCGARLCRAIATGIFEFQSNPLVKIVYHHVAKQWNHVIVSYETSHFKFKF